MIVTLLSEVRMAVRALNLPMGVSQVPQYKPPPRHLEKHYWAAQHFGTTSYTVNTQRITHKMKGVVKQTLKLIVHRIIHITTYHVFLHQLLKYSPKIIGLD